MEGLKKNIMGSQLNTHTPQKTMWRMTEKSIYVRQREGDCPSLRWGWGGGRWEALRRGRGHAGVGLAVILFVVVKKLY